MPLNDTKLITQIQRGNTTCANELVERYYSSILRYCSWHCNNIDRAEDLAQETFLRVFRDIYTYEQKGSFKAYLYTIAHHLCIDENRKYRTSELNENFPIEDKRLRQVEDRDQINSLLNLLTPSQKKRFYSIMANSLVFAKFHKFLIYRHELSKAGLEPL